MIFTLPGLLYPVRRGVTHSGVTWFSLGTRYLPGLAAPLVALSEQRLSLFGSCSLIIEKTKFCNYTYFFIIENEI